jgi:hypothetical protein
MCPYWQFRSVDEKKVRRNTWLKVSSLAAAMGTYCCLRNKPEVSKYANTLWA